MKIVRKKIGFANKISYNIDMHIHKHIYVYQFEMKNHPTWSGHAFYNNVEYTLCTRSMTDPTSKAE
jgi:hypothetical protein